MPLIPEALRHEEAQRGARVRKRYSDRQGTLVYVTWLARAWPALEVRWDDDPAYVARVMQYDIALVPSEEGLPPLK